MKCSTWCPPPQTPEEPPEPSLFPLLLEVTAVTLMLPALGLWQRPHDPFFLQSAFPWLLLAPLLLGLRYGFAQGLGSAGILGVLMYVFFRAGYPGVPSFPGSLALGLLLTATLAGTFCGMWQSRLRRARELCYYHHLLVQKFTRSYQLLSLSHERLEGRVLTNTRSLREAMTYLRDRAAAADRESADRGVLYRLMMEALESYGRLQVAALYPVDEYGIIVPQVAAKLGNPAWVPLGDPLLEQALKTRQLTCIRPEGAPVPLTEAQRPSVAETLTAVIPLGDVHGRLWAVVAVQAMPFEALSLNHLPLLAVIGGHMGDLLSLPAGGGVHQFHTCLLRCHRDAREHGLPAMLVGLALDPALDPPSLLDEMLAQDRGLDQQWLTCNRHGQRVLVLVMPLTDAQGAERFVLRLESWHQARYGRPLSGSGVQIHQVALDGVGRAQDKLRQLKVKESCDVHGA